MGKKILLISLLCCCFSAIVIGANRTFTLVIDAGHGGRDAGAVGKISKEKNINLNVALAFGQLVERNCPDVKVVYTRKTDKFLGLHERATIANKQHANLFISIHTNALPKKRISRGIETYTLGMHRAADNLEVAKRENDVILLESDYKQRYEGFDPNSTESYIIFEFMQDHNMEQSVEMARLIQQKTCSSTGRKNKGVKQAGFLVLRETSMPSCLVELGFISTPDEERYLNSKQGINNFGTGLYRAFVEYKRKYYGGHHAPAEPLNIEEDPQVAIPQVNDKPAALSSTRPVFKVQILVSDTKMKNGDKRFKGCRDVDYYQENGMYKYTVGASEDYNEINALKRKLNKQFPKAFVIAFKNGKRTDIQKAITEFKVNKRK